MTPELRAEILKRSAVTHARIRDAVGAELFDKFLEIIDRVEKEVAAGK